MPPPTPPPHRRLYRESTVPYKEPPRVGRPPAKGMVRKGRPAEKPKLRYPLVPNRIGRVGFVCPLCQRLHLDHRTHFIACFRSTYNRALEQGAEGAALLARLDTVGHNGSLSEEEVGFQYDLALHEGLFIRVSAEVPVPEPIDDLTPFNPTLAPRWASGTDEHGNAIYDLDVLRAAFAQAQQYAHGAGDIQCRIDVAKPADIYKLPLPIPSAPPSPQVDDDCHVVEDEESEEEEVVKEEVVKEEEVVKVKVIKVVKVVEEIVKAVGDDGAGPSGDADAGGRKPKRGRPRKPSPTGQRGRPRKYRASEVPSSKRKAGGDPPPETPPEKRARKD